MLIVDGHEALAYNVPVDGRNYLRSALATRQEVDVRTDVDGGFGAEAMPAKIDTIAHLQHLAPALAARGYREADVAAILHGNWLRVVRGCLPG